MEEEIIDSSFFSEELDDKLSVDVKKTGLENTFNERQVGSIAMPIETVSSQASLDAALAMFEQQPDLAAIPIEKDDHVIGVIERETVEANTNTAFKRLVSKTCGDYVKECPFTINCSDFLEKVAARVNECAINIEIKHFVVLLNNRSFYGIMSVAKMNQQLEQLRTHDMSKAEAIQQNMLKKCSDTTGFPFNVCIWNRMANPVGGDYYVAKEICKDIYAVGCFDVSGKNVSASLLTVTLGSLFSMLTFKDPARVNASKLVVMIDNFLKEIVPVGNFITGALCYVDMKAKTVELFNCGHTNVFAFLKDEGGKSRLATLKPSLPPFGMGAVSEAVSGSATKAGYRMPIIDGLQIDLYSDGFTDMQSEEGVRYEETRTKAFFGKLFETDQQDVVKEIEETVNAWIQQTLLPDDITVMNIRF